MVDAVFFRFGVLVADEAVGAVVRRALRCVTVQRVLPCLLLLRHDWHAPMQFGA